MKSENYFLMGVCFILEHRCQEANCGDIMLKRDAVALDFRTGIIRLSSYFAPLELDLLSPRYGEWRANI
jgi:hypothetical protein